MATPPTRPARLTAALLVALITLLSAGLIGACDEEGVELPKKSLNTLKFRKFTVNASKTIEDEDIVKVRALNGMHGATVPVVLGDADLRLKYWGRTVGSKEEDGAHVNIVRVGADTSCDISLERIFPSGDSNDSGFPDKYDFEALDEHLASIKDLNTAKLLWQPVFNPGGTCQADSSGLQKGVPLTAAGSADLWATVVVNTLRHLREGEKTASNPTAWDPNGVKLPVDYVEFLDDPISRLGYSEANVEVLFVNYLIFANKVKVQFPDSTDDGSPEIHVGGLSFTLTSPEELDFVSDDSKHPILKFIDFAADQVQPAPLDFLTWRAKTEHPWQIAAIATKLRAYLDSKGKDDVKLICTAMDYDRTNAELAARGILSDDMLASSYLGAFQAAARIYMQDVPVDFAIAGRGPRVYSDLSSHVGDDPSAIAELIVPSDYFEGDGTTLPAFMALFPFRQVTGHQRYPIIEGPDTEGFTVMASRSKESDRTLHVIVSNANVLSGDTGLNADITYQLDISGWVQPNVQSVEYKFAVLDRDSIGIDSFHFSETGIVETLQGAAAGTVSFLHQIAVPSIHYIQFVKPDPGT